MSPPWDVDSVSTFGKCKRTGMMSESLVLARRKRSLPVSKSSAALDFKAAIVVELSGSCVDDFFGRR